MNTTITVQCTNTFEIVLRSSPGTGYLWSIPTIPSNLELLEEQTRTSEADPQVGGASDQVFVFRAIQHGTVELTFCLKRPWETEVLATRSWQIIIG